MSHIVEQDVEDAALEILETDLGYKYVYGPDIAPDSEKPLRKRFDDVVLEDNLKTALKKINPTVPGSAIEEAVKKIQRFQSKEIVRNNQKFHEILIEGLPLQYRDQTGKIKNSTINLIDFKHPENNEFLAINQFTIIEKTNRRPDVIIFINGLPLIIIELKNPADEHATLDSAYNQLETYKDEIPTLFNYNEIAIISDGTYAQVGTITSPREWFLPWKTIDGKKQAPRVIPQLQVALEGMFKKQTLLDIIRYFITFSKEKRKTRKLIAGYHQYHATNKAIKTTLAAIGKNRKAGVIWHTQGSGKSLTLALYAGKLQLQEELKNPTVVILTDRNDLDDQLFNTFSNIACLREHPIQVDTTEKLKEALKRSSGGIIFSTIQKFGAKSGEFELLSERDNIIIAADEAHRTQYGFKAKIDKKTGKKTYGFAKYLRDALPNASFIGFTGTPIEFEDKSTPAIFGEYIDIYDIQQSIEDKRTVKIFYESRLARLQLKKEQAKKLDEEIDEIEEEDEEKEKLKTQWSRVEKLVGANARIKDIAKDIVTHYEARRELNTGKAMIVCMSRRICVDMYEQIKKLRPQWVNNDDDKGQLNVIMTGSASDGPNWQKHIRNKKRRKELGERFKDSSSGFDIAIVQGMWLTGFDVPSLDTLYIDKPMKGHGLMQAIARVNRVYGDKEGGLIVDYIGIAQDLKKAIMLYTKSGGRGKPFDRKDEAISALQEKYEIVKQMYHNFNYKKFFTVGPKEKMQIIPAAMEHILGQKDGKKRYVKQVALLSKALSLAVPSKEAEKLRDDIGFFEAIKAAIIKDTESDGKKTTQEMKYHINQVVSKAFESEGIEDLFKERGIDKPEVSTLSDSFLEDVKNIQYKNLAIESLQKILNDQIKIRFKTNRVKSKKFSDMLEEAITRYHNRAVDSTYVIEQLVALAKEIREEKSRGKELGLSEEEEAFYDALIDNDSAKEILSEEVLKKMAVELADLIRKNNTVDWTVRKNVQAKLRIQIKRLLRKYGYPPNKEKMAIELVIEQAEAKALQQAENKD